MKKLLVNKIEELGWNVSITDCKDNKYCFELSKFSPAGQDFNIAVYVDDLSDFNRALYDVYDNYDVSEETMLWLDPSGHGANGAPYDMKDVYEDMEACKDALLDLYDELTVYLKTLETNQFNKKIMKVNVYNGSELDSTIDTEFADERGIDLLNFVAKSLNYAVYRVEDGVPVGRIRKEKNRLYNAKHNNDYFIQTRSNTTYVLRDSNCVVLDLLRDKGAVYQRDFFDKFQKEFALFGKTYKLVNDNE